MVLFAAVAVPQPASADEAGDFHAATADAHGHYRQALFYLKRGAPDVAALELEAFAAKWDRLMGRFAARPPDVYADDPKWRDTLTGIGERARSGLKLAADGKARQARDALTPVRGAIVQLRRRNGVFLFADCVEEANGAFRKLFKFRHEPPTFTDEAQTNTLRRRLADTIHWYERCRDTAPPAVAGDEQFKRLIGDSLFYLGRMWIAIDEKNQLNVINILRRVVSSDDLLWLRFG